MGQACFSFGCGDDAPEPHHVQGAHEAPILTVVDQFFCVVGHGAALRALRAAPICFSARIVEAGTPALFQIPQLLSSTQLPCDNGEIAAESV